MDVSGMGSTIGLAAAIVTLTVAMLGTGTVIRSGWRKTVGRRRSQTVLLDRLACGASERYIDSLLGPPMFVSSDQSATEHTYRLPGAWVLVGFRNGSVSWFSITIRRPGFHYDATTLTHGNLRIHLGKEQFRRLSTRFDGSYGWIGARRAGYLERYYFGNAGAYQYYWLSYNQSGIGDLKPAETCATGCYAEARNTNGSADAYGGRSGTSPNTLTVLSPHFDPEILMHRDVLGADIDSVRLAV